MASDETLNDWQRRCYALVDEKYALEQQLAQARADAEHFAELGQEADIKAAAVLEEHAAMRALLERARRALASELPEVRMAVTVHDEETAHRLRRQFLDEISAVLAQHKEATDGK